MSNIAISVENLSKKYNLGSINSGSFSEDLIKGWAKIRGKQDPTIQIGAEHLPQEYWALKGIDFEIHKGDSVGIIGKNGAGKSTLLKILSRVTTPTTGKININGRIASLLEVGTGFHPDLTGRENIYMNGAILGMGRLEIKSKLEEIIEFSGVDKYIETPVKRYSSGMYVRLAFAVAAHLEPEILIIDEVLAVGDAEFQKKCLGKMSEVSNDGRTILFVSHNMGAVSELCNKAIVLSKGEIIFTGDSASGISTYTNLNSGNLKSGVFKADPKKSSFKHNFIASVSISDQKFNIKDNFSFDESMVLSVLLKSNEGPLDTTLSVTMLTKSQNKVFTVHKKITSEQAEKEILLKMPSGIFAPNFYSFEVSSLVHNKIVYDSVENVCQVQIIDNGTENALFEGLDYGSIIIQPEWILKS
ncbi:MAG: ABC transporter ATP-binding protein [Bacteroidia bacterium]|nr:ABC transporter ATP-binding protein [Bacteroidia bacterium]